MSCLNQPRIEAHIQKGKTRTAIIPSGYDEVCILRKIKSVNTKHLLTIIIIQLISAIEFKHSYFSFYSYQFI